MIDQLAKEMFSHFQTQAESLKGVKTFSEQQFRSMAESTLKNLNFVSREEFDIQVAVVERSRAKIDMLEKQVDELQAKLKALQAD